MYWTIKKVIALFAVVVVYGIGPFKPLHKQVCSA
jgi:hypothetical protein